MKDILINYIKNRLSEIKLSDENSFLRSVFPKNGDIIIDSRRFTVTYQHKYPRSNKTCDLLLKSSNSEINVWIEGKKEIKLLPINCCHIPERIILSNDSNYLDIARLIALVDNQYNLKLTLSTVNGEIFEYYKRRLLCAEIIDDNTCETQIKSKFVCIDILPVEINRKKIVELYCKAILDTYFIKLSSNNTYVVISFIERGVVSLKVYRDIDNPNYEGKKYCYGVDENSDNEFLLKYFPSS